jgi:hypothetical protein
MPISYVIDQVAQRVTLTYFGTVTDADLFAVYEKLYSDPRHRVGMDELADCRPVDKLELTGQGLRDLASRATFSMDSRRVSWRVAVVAPQDAIYGMARMFQSLRDDSPEEVQVFRDLVSALYWLNQPAAGERGHG